MYYSRNKVIKRHIKDIKKASYPPVFESDKDFYSKSELNCYAYALQLKTDVVSLRKRCQSEYLYYMPGLLSKSNYNPNFISSHIVDYFLSDLDTFGIKHEETHEDAEIEENAYKIAVYKSLVANFDFHFMRQNVDGSWSEKAGKYGEVKKRNLYVISDLHVLETIVKIKR